MRIALTAFLLVVVAACTPVACDDRERDGGIGGTGTCQKDEPKSVLAQDLGDNDAQRG